MPDAAYSTPGCKFRNIKLSKTGIFGAKPRVIMLGNLGCQLPMLHPNVSFESQYCRTRWDMGRSCANRYVQAAGLALTENGYDRTDNLTKNQILTSLVWGNKPHIANTLLSRPCCGSCSLCCELGLLHGLRQSSGGPGPGGIRRGRYERFPHGRKRRSSFVGSASLLCSPTWLRSLELGAGRARCGSHFWCGSGFLS